MTAMKRLGYIGVILSYVIFASAAIFFNFVLPSYRGIVVGALIVVGVIISFVSMYLIEVKAAAEVTDNDKIDSLLRVICYIPVIVVIGIPILILSTCFTLIDYVRNNIKKQIKPLIAIGFELRLQRQEKKKVCFLTKGECVIKIIRNELYEISFDNSVSFVNITDSSLGTPKEKQDLLDSVYRYNNCDYRDREGIELTPLFVDFLVKNIG